MTEMGLGTSAKRLLIAAALCLAGAAISGLLLLQHHGEQSASAAVSQVCGEGQESGCDIVNQSVYAAAFGMPLAGIGLFFYLSLLVLMTLGLLAPEVRDSAAAVALVLVVIALLIDAGLLAIQVATIKAFCKLCLFTYLLNAAILYVLLPARRAFSALRGLSSQVEGRLLLAGWVAGSLAVAAAVAGAQSTLTLRASARGRALIGLPETPRPAATSAAPPAVAVAASPGPAVAQTPAPIPPGGEAQHYKELAEKLQQTLDDPQKLEQYFATKAAQEFDKAQVQSMDLTDVPFKGPAGAPVQIVEYFDYLCPFCRQLAAGLDNFLPQAGNRVVVYYKNYPLDQACNPDLKQTVHAGACWLALGGICSGYQGKFAGYQGKVMTTEAHNPGPADVVRMATEAGLNPTAFEACLNDPKTKQRLTAEINEAKRVGVQATPTLFINGKKLPRLQDFVSTVDKEAQRKGSAPLPTNIR